MLVDLRTRLASEAAEKGWAKLQDSYGVNRGILWRIVHKGYEPKRTDIREALGLPPLVEVVMANGRKVSRGALVIRDACLCACGCGLAFVPGHPQQLYLKGHRKHRRR